jgi:hypothetical protein
MRHTEAPCDYYYLFLQKYYILFHTKQERICYVDPG